MATIILNKDTATEFSLNIETINEDMTVPILTCTKIYELQPGGTTPTIPPLLTTIVSSVNIVSDKGIAIPIGGSYNAVANYSTNFSESTNTLKVHLALEY